MRRLLMLAALVLVAHPAFGQSNELRRLANQLASDSASFADASYNDYTRGYRIAGNDINAVMAAYQFSGAAQVFNRLVNDRRRNQDLRTAFSNLQNAAQNASQNNLQRNRWNDIERLLSDMSREINYSGGDDPFPYPGDSRSGRMTWRGRVDDDVRIVIRGGSAQVETIGGTEYFDAATNFTASLPRRRVNVTLVKRRGRGEVFIEQQPSRENDFAAVIRIRDSRGGASEYEFEVSW